MALKETMTIYNDSTYFEEAQKIPIQIKQQELLFAID